MPFIDSLDIANRALQHVGGNQIASVDEDSKNNEEVSFAYDKERRAELRENVWRFAIRKVVLRPLDTTTLLLNPPLFDVNATYLLGAVVRDTNGQYWISRIPDNEDHPGDNNESWDAYFGPVSVALWASSTSYFRGELVYKAGAVTGSYQVYQSLKDGNTDQPDVATAWDIATTYYADQVVSNGGFQWRNLLPFNVGLTPAVGPADWASGTTYAIGNQVTGSNQKIYTSLTNGNIGNDPTNSFVGPSNWTDTNTYTAWAKSPTLTAAAMSWLPLGDTALKAVAINYPVGVGPFTDQTTRNAYCLPAGFLRQAPRDPKAGSTSSLGAPSGLPYDDWTLENDLIVTTDVNPIVFRFVADVMTVRSFDDMFSESLAARVALAVADPLTQSSEDFKKIAGVYDRFVSRAKTVNGIETGPTEPPEDDYIECRA